jgi:hypothetical protein
MINSDLHHVEEAHTPTRIETSLRTPMSLKQGRNTSKMNSMQNSQQSLQSPTKSGQSRKRLETEKKMKVNFMIQPKYSIL